METGALVPFVSITAFWGVIGIICPFFAKGPDRGVIRTCLILTAICAWLFYLCAFLVQLNPLEGPILMKSVHMMLACYWGDKVYEQCDNPTK